VSTQGRISSPILQICSTSSSALIRLLDGRVLTSFQAQSSEFGERYPEWELSAGQEAVDYHVFLPVKVDI
jgi:hypothetical protein